MQMLKIPARSTVRWTGVKQTQSDLFLRDSVANAIIWFTIAVLMIIEKIVA